MNLARELDERLPSSVTQALRTVGVIAESLGMAAFAVGGFVRDLLLGTPTLDVDIVAEGDGTKLAQALAKQWGGTVTVHERFLTATLHWAMGRWDVATARKERYPQPAALPKVEPATIADDLWRRDFSVNAMAICLSPDRFGELIDPTGGYDDLQKGIIRILHDGSFVDDPTRIFRAVRYEQRFGFRMDAKTLRLLCQARDESWLTKLSRDRIKHELWRTLQERDPTKPFQRLWQLGILQVVAPELRITKARLQWLKQTGEWLRWHQGHFPDEALQREWALLLSLLPTADAVTTFCQRYQLGEWERQSGLALLRVLRSRLPKRPSGWVRKFNPLPLEAALALAAKRSSVAKESWQRYFLEWRRTRPDITGEALKAHGVEGRAIAVGLQAALAAKLDENADADKQLGVALRAARRFLRRSGLR
jgi:tRNA nucleotidyltransferase (CCA-adding enzyme)